MPVNLKAERNKLLHRALAEDRRLGAELRALRESKRLKASWLANRMGISATYISELERGTRHWNEALEKTYREALK